MDRVPGDVHRGDRRVPDVHFFAVAALAGRGARGMSDNWKYLLDAVLVVLIVALVWTGLRGWMQRRNDDRPGG